MNISIFPQHLKYGFTPLPFIPLMLPSPHKHNTAVHVRESFFLHASTL